MRTKPIHLQIKEARLAKGWSQGDFAKALGYAHQSTVARLENGDHEVKLATLQRVANVTGCTFMLEIKPQK